MTSLVISSNFNRQDLKALNLLNACKEYAIDKNNVLVTAKQLSDIMGCATRTVYRRLKALKGTLVTDIMSITGRGGGYQVTFNPDKINFVSDKEALINTLDISTEDMVKGIEEGSFDDLVAKAEEENSTGNKGMRKALSRRKRVALRGRVAKELNAELNYGKPTWEQFKRWENPEANLHGYMLGQLYSYYAWAVDIYQNQDEQSHEMTYNNAWDVFGDEQDIFGSAVLTNFANFASEMAERGINPVYYLSSLFQRELFRLTSKKDNKIKIPFPSSLTSEGNWATFKTYQDYDLKYYNKQATQTHQTILFQDNPYVNQLFSFFEMTMNTDRDKETIATDYVLSQYKLVANLREEAKLPKEVAGSGSLEMITRTMGAFMEDVEDQVSELTNIDNNTKHLFIKELGLLYASSYRGLNNVEFSAINSNVISKTLRPLAEKLNNVDIQFEEDDENIIRPYELAQGSETMYKQLQKHIAPNSGLDAQVMWLRDEITKAPENYAALDKLLQAGDLYSDYLGLNNLSVKEFYTIAKSLGNAIPFTKNNLIDTKQVVKKYIDKTHRPSYSDNMHH